MAVAHPGQRDGVADQHQPVRRLEPGDERPERRMDMDAVGDQLDVGRVVEQGGHGDARRAVVDAAHGVEEVRRRSRAGREAAVRLLEGRRRMTERDGDAAIAEPADELGRARQLRRDRHQSEAIDERLERRERHVRGHQEVGRVVGTPPHGGEERPLQVEAQRLGAVGRAVREPSPDALGEGDQLVQRRGHGGRQERGHAATQEPPGHAVERVAVAHRVVAAPAVDVEVDEARRDERAALRWLVVEGRPPRSTRPRRDRAAHDPIVEHEPAADDRRRLHRHRPLRIGRPSVSPAAPGSGRSTSKCTSSP